MSNEGFRVWQTEGFRPLYPMSSEPEEPKGFLDKYFDDHEWYPKGVMDNLLPWGTLWCYISSTFLDGMINYVTIESAFVGNRYSPDNSKSEILDLERGKFHTKLDVFGDDIVILASIAEGKYAYFYYDMDVSDCSIGRFETDTPKNKLLEEFRKHCETEIENFVDMPFELPKDFFTGWIRL